MQLHEPQEPNKKRSNDLREHGIDEAQAADLRFRLKSFMEDWDDPAMDVYDDYDNALKALKADGE